MKMVADRKSLRDADTIYDNSSAVYVQDRGVKKKKSEKKIQKDRSAYALNFERDTFYYCQYVAVVWVDGRRCRRRSEEGRFA